MKVLILDCIKKDIISETMIVLEKFTDGIKDAGGEIKVHNIQDLDIKPCFSCTSQSSFQYNDKCRCDDDMNNLYPDFRKSDVWVFVSHINSNGATTYLKNLLDRMEPLFQPIYMLDSASVTMPPDNKLNGKILLLSSYEYECADLARSISDYIDSIAMLFSKETAGNILFDKSRIDSSRLEQFFKAGQSIVLNARN
jgi:multimeric flavodoxin WrbA